MHIPNDTKHPCKFCGNAKNTVLYREKIYTIVKCANCGLSYLTPQPTADNLKLMYNSDYFSSADVGSGYSDYSCLQHDLEMEALRRISLIQKYIRKGTLLDVGCGFGTFLLIAKDNGFFVTGCDVSEDAIRNLENNKIKAIRTGIASTKLPGGPYDVLTAWDMIEHVINPTQTAKAFYDAQKPGGYLFLTTPDLHSTDARILGKNWYGFKRIPEHLFYFTPQSLRNVLEQAGYEVLEVRRWGFQRNLAYCVDQIARYNKFLWKLLNPVSEHLGFKNISLYFPFIDMFIVARKPKTRCA